MSAGKAVDHPAKPARSNHPATDWERIPSAPWNLAENTRRAGKGPPLRIPEPMSVKDLVFIMSLNNSNSCLIQQPIDQFVAKNVHPAENGLYYGFNGIFDRPCTLGKGWCPRPELNWDQRFRKPLLYPFELRGRNYFVENTPAAANGKRNAGGASVLASRNHFTLPPPFFQLTSRHVQTSRPV